MCDASAVYPKYLRDVGILSCRRHLKRPKTAGDAREAIDDRDYIYTGYVLENDTQVKAFVKAYADATKSGGRLTEDLRVPPGTGNCGSDTIYRLREGVERLLITDVNSLGAGRLGQGSIPVLIERLGNHTRNRDPGANVLFMDGQAKFMPYPGKWPMTKDSIESLESLDKLK